MLCPHCGFPIAFKDMTGLDKPIESLDLCNRVTKALIRRGIRTLGELCCKSERELRSIQGFGVTSVREAKRKLLEYGLRLADDPPRWRQPLTPP